MKLSFPRGKIEMFNSFYCCQMISTVNCMSEQCLLSTWNVHWKCVEHYHHHHHHPPLLVEEHLLSISRCCSLSHSISPSVHVVLIESLSEFSRRIVLKMGFHLTPHSHLNQKHTHAHKHTHNLVQRKINKAKDVKTWTMHTNRTSSLFT